MANLIVLDMIDFDVIIFMGWLHAYYAYVYFRTRIVKYKFPNEPVVELNSSSAVPKGCFLFLTIRKEI